jgi:hypothetical protein
MKVRIFYVSVAVRPPWTLALCWNMPGTSASPPQHHVVYAERDFHHPPQNMVPVILVAQYSPCLLHFLCFH